ncbi:MAG: ribosome biogenesis GTPase Der [Deltaproteobacteria bacterium]|nr:ribosome biogenesis GTPase Der [Deltaproteobacteria bacterium]
MTTDNTEDREIEVVHEPRPPRTLVAVVGRPNVGKSTIFNRLVGRREAIVHDEPGVTRDRHYALVQSLGHTYTVVDTGGFDPESDDPMRQGIARQVQIAVSEADLVVCVLDAMQGPTDADRQAVKLLRKSSRPVIYVANKADSARSELESSELYRLGLDRILPVSALHGRGFNALEDAIVKLLPPQTADLAPEAADPALLRVAIVGRPNAGKSSMVNRLAGEDRMLVDDRPGTTRDPVDTIVERDGLKLLLIDTAGIRRKSKVTKENDTVEVISVLRAMRSIDACDVVVLLCDATIGVAEQDAKILGLAVDRARGAIIALNKIDQLDSSTYKKLEQDTRDKLSFAPWVPIVRTSALKGRGVGTLLRKLAEVQANFRKRIPTGELNRFFEKVLATHPPPTSGGSAPRLFYITQAEASPPLFVVMSNAPAAVHFSYQRYVTNQIRKHFGFEGVPVRVAYREKRKHKLGQR